MKVILTGRDNAPVAELSIDEEVIVEATMVEYQGRFYSYRHQAGQFLTKPVFGECNPPVKLD